MNQTLSTEELSWQQFPQSQLAIYIAGFATGVSLVVSSITVHRHLVHWSKPRTQGQIIRIVLVCPIYALASLLSLIVSEAASLYVETVRDLFEAFVIYTFLALVLEYAGGEAACVAKICHMPPLRHPLGPCARALPTMPRNHLLLRKCKQGTLQFVIVKPLMAFTGLIAALAGAYSNYWYQACVLLIYNVSYTLALYWLFVVYLATKSVIARHSPVAKFVAVKGIVFATYYQSLAVAFFPGLPREDGTRWNDFILCVEMIGFAGLIMRAFCWREYVTGVPDKRWLENLKGVVSVRDVVQDIRHNFVPTYQVRARAEYSLGVASSV